VRSPKYTLDDVGGLDRAKQLFEAVRWTWEHPEETKQYGIIPPRRLLFIGLQGSGKSLIAEAAAQGLGLDLAKGGVSSAMTKWVGESERKMRLMFKQLRAMAPIVFWVDELGRDLSGGASSSETDGGTTDRVHGEFLSGLQELEQDVFLLAAANRIDHLPPEMTRADRFDKIMFVGFPSEEERQEIWAIHLGEQGMDMDLRVLAGATQFFTGAEIKALVRNVRFDVAATDRRAARTEDFVAAIPHIKSRAWTRHKGEIVAMYERARDEWDWASSQQEEEAPTVIKAAKAPAFTPKVHTPAADFSPASFDS
jgi:SpoVK/Ycf46/Vps4 family AAA+-type ATPase